MYPNRWIWANLFAVFIFSFLFTLGHAQRQRIDGAASNGRSTQEQQLPQRFIPNPQKLVRSSQSLTATQAQQLQPQYQQQQQIPQQQQYYSYNSNNYNGANGNGDSSQVQYVPQSSYQQQQAQAQQYYNNQQQSQQIQSAYNSNGIGQQQQQEGRGQYYYAYGAQQQPVNQAIGVQSAGGNYGQTQAIPLISNSGSQQSAGQQQYGGSNQVNGQQQQFTTPAPLTLPPVPPTLATLMPSLFPTPPPPPVYDQSAAMRFLNQPYQYNFDFAPGTPVVYCAYGANPIPVYNTPYKKCIPYHPLCGVTFTCIFDVDPQTGHVWGHAQGTRKK